MLLGFNSSTSFHRRFTLADPDVYNVQDGQDKVSMNKPSTSRLARSSSRSTQAISVLQKSSA